METHKEIKVSGSISQMYSSMFKFNLLDAIFLLTFMLAGAVLDGWLGAAIGILVYFLLYLTMFAIFIPFGSVIVYFLGDYYLHSLHSFLYTNNHLVTYGFLFLIPYYILWIMMMVMGAFATIIELGILFDVA